MLTGIVTFLESGCDLPVESLLAVHTVVLAVLAVLVIYLILRSGNSSNKRTVSSSQGLQARKAAPNANAGGDEDGEEIAAAIAAAIAMYTQETGERDSATVQAPFRIASVRRIH